MTAWLIRRFVRDHTNVTDPAVRTAYGTLGSIVGVVVNLLLAGGKCLMGVLSGSIAMMADAANNLSDAAASVVAFITVRLAHKPVDEDHPFGHGRMEYLGSLAVGVLIVIMGVNLLKDGVAAILHPVVPTVNWAVIAVPVLAVLGKWWLYVFYTKVGGSTGNSALLAAAKDSLSDMLATGAVLLSMLCSVFFGWKIDGWIGVLVSLIVLKAGWEVCRGTVDNLLGGRPDPEKIQQLREMLLAREGIMGIHDLVLHDYGPGRCFASVHAEVDADGNVLDLHEMIDDAEREIGEKMRMPICIHMDPIVTSDETVQRVRQQISDFVTRIDPALSIHDFRMVPGDGHTNLIFDCLLPTGYPSRDTLMNALNAFALSLDERYRLVVMFDTDYT